jgi:hypothetical protein
VIPIVPKAKPDRVDVLRFEVQEKEREMLESLLATYQVRTGASFFSGLVDSVSKMDLPTLYLLVTIIEIITGREILPGTPNDFMGLVNDLRNGLSDFDLVDFYNQNIGGDLGKVQQEAIDPDRQEAMVDIYTNQQTGAAPESVADIYREAYGIE